MTNSHHIETRDLIDSVLEATNVLMGIAARSVIDVEDTVSTPQLRVLVFVALRGSQSASAVARELNVHASNATRICDRLIRVGLLSRTGGDDDRRFVRLELTETGSKLVARVFEQRRTAVARVIESIPEGQREAVLDAFRVFAAAADVEGIADGRFALAFP